MRIERAVHVPPGIQSEYELWVWQALVSLGYRPQLQQQFRGGTAFPGGMRVDFVVPEIVTVVRVMSWHHTGPGAEARDEYQKAYLGSQGYQVLDCWPGRLGSTSAVRRWLRRHLGRPVA